MPLYDPKYDPSKQYSYGDFSPEDFANLDQVTQTNLRFNHNTVYGWALNNSRGQGIGTSPVTPGPTGTATSPIDPANPAPINNGSSPSLAYGAPGETSMTGAADPNAQAMSGLASVLGGAMSGDGPSMPGGAKTAAMKGLKSSTLAYQSAPGGLY